MFRVGLRLLLVSVSVAAALLLGAQAHFYTSLHLHSVHAGQLLDYSAPQDLETGSHRRSLRVFWRLVKKLKGTDGDDDDVAAETPISDNISNSNNGLNLNIPVEDEDADHSPVVRPYWPTYVTLHLVRITLNLSLIHI